MKKIQNFLSENFHFLVVKFSVYLIGVFSLCPIPLNPFTNTKATPKHLLARRVIAFTLSYLFGSTINMMNIFEKYRSRSK